MAMVLVVLVVWAVLSVPAALLACALLRGGVRR